MINIPVGVLVLFMLFMFLLAGMACEAYIRPWLLMHSHIIKKLRKRTYNIKAERFRNDKIYLPFHSF